MPRGLLLRHRRHCRDGVRGRKVQCAHGAEHHIGVPELPCRVLWRHVCHDFCSLHCALSCRAVRRLGCHDLLFLHGAVQRGVLVQRGLCQRHAEFLRLRHLGRSGRHRLHLQRRVQCGRVRPGRQRAHCRQLQRAVQRGALLPRRLVQRHAECVPTRDFWGLHGAQHCRLLRAVLCGLLRELCGADDGHLQRPVRVRHVGRSGRHCLYVQRHVQRGQVWPGRQRAHRRHVRRGVQRRVLLCCRLVQRRAVCVPIRHLRRRHWAEHGSLHGAVCCRLLRELRGADGGHL
jgi:hypothetical protein